MPKSGAEEWCQDLGGGTREWCKVVLSSNTEVPESVIGWEGGHLILTPPGHWHHSSATLHVSANQKA